MFATEYYCLVAGLKEYSLDADTKGFDAKAIVGEILDGAVSYTHLDVYKRQKHSNFGEMFPRTVKNKIPEYLCLLNKIYSRSKNTD